jgi:hypothetical protein
VNTSRPIVVRLPSAPAQDERALLLQFLALSLLIHILIVLIFGSRIAPKDGRPAACSTSR